MSNFKCCSACLVANVKMFCLSTKPTTNSTCTLGQIFSEFLGFPSIEKYNCICFECARLLCKFQEFKLRCHKAQILLSTLVEDDPDIIKQVIKNDDSKIRTLSSKLSFSSIITTNNQFDNVMVELNKEVCTKVVVNDDSIDINTHSIHNNETKVQTIDEVHNFQSNKEVNETIATIENNNIKTEGNENTLNRNTVEFTTEYNSDDECEIIGEYLESEEENLYYSDSSDSTKEHNKDLDVTMPINENIGDSETVKTKKKKTVSYNNEKFYEGFATVVLLTPEEAKKELLLRKESNNYNFCPYKCDLCYRGFDSQAAYENHKKKHTEVDGDYECDLCHIRYKAKRNLYNHICKTHKWKFICKLCPYVSFSSGQANTHVSLHKGKKYPCDACGQVFSMPNSLMSHKRYKHQTKCVCEFCGDAFATSHGLHLHKKMIHKLEINKKEGPYCEACDIHFATEMAWNKHLVLKHGVSNGCCKHCGKMFTNKEELKSHSKIHRYTRKNISQKYPVACVLCKKMLSNGKEFKSHMTSEHPQSDAAEKINKRKEKRFICETCGKAFTMPCLLSAHQRMHTGERPYACAECGKTFAQPHALAVHRDAHHRRLRHTCRLCQRTFTRPGSLQKHMKTHLNIRPHKCSICDKSFFYACERNQHIKHVHNNVPWPKKKEKSKRKNTKKAAQNT